MESNNYSNFELQLFVLELGNPLLIAVIHRPPKVNANFLTEFLGDVTLKYDKCHGVRGCQERGDEELLETHFTSFRNTEHGDNRDRGRQTSHR